MNWLPVAEEVFNSGKVVMVLGGVDTGKTYLSRQLANYLVNRGRKVAIVDADVGQAYVGPPATIGLGMITKELSPEENIPPASFYFVGSVSPVRFFLPTVVGTKLMVEKALHLGAEVVIVDTCGLIQNGLGKILKCSEIELVVPRHILALQRKDELEHILCTYQFLNIVIHRLKVSPLVKVRTPKMRADYRYFRFKSFFEGAQEQEISLSKVVVSNKLGEPKFYRNILVSLDDESGEVLSLGILKSLSLAKEKILLKTPLKTLEKVRRIQLSEYQVEL